ncbi:hypothetical protein M3936_21830 [Sutcliffiella horikoshii]|uniref:hypothetical protein n=1 Tax=Sutcliffiella horikoshii TaxID=79883 RepID=UPI0007D0A27B|nr:hypothetical protein [Sutcliffiella horikoshii]MCM3620201.1 hypothetical protein [Sutcliffiella horikoshii]
MSPVIKDTYKFPFSSGEFLHNASPTLKNLLGRNEEINESIVQSKKHLSNQAGEYIDSLEKFLEMYSRITTSQAQDQHRLLFEHHSRFAAFLKEAHVRDYKLYYEEE